MKVALTGNPNSGKTTLFNAVTGKIEKVGNWAGVTIDKKEGEIKNKLYKLDETMIAVDLPGAYSMSPFTSEESITRDFVKNEKPDVIINIVDATNISRSLFFTSQLLELDIPLVVALNKSDLNKKKQNTINTEELSKLLHCPVVETVSTATANNGHAKLMEEVIKVRGSKQKAPYKNDKIDPSKRSQVEEADKKRFVFDLVIPT